MNALDEGNILTDNGPVDISIIRLIERTLGIKLPKAYVDFIIKHNGAYLVNNAFEFFDQNVNEPSESSLHFDDITDMLSHVWVLSSLSTEFKNDPDPHRGYHYFPKKLVPFCSNGDCICFDYRNDPMEWPPIVMWHHEACEGDVNVSFIANTFEEFIGMLHEYRG